MLPVHPVFPFPAHCPVCPLDEVAATSVHAHLLGILVKASRRPHANQVLDHFGLCIAWDGEAGTLLKVRDDSAFIAVRPFLQLLAGIC